MIHRRRLHWPAKSSIDLVGRTTDDGGRNIDRRLFPSSGWISFEKTNPYVLELPFEVCTCLIACSASSRLTTFGMTLLGGIIWLADWVLDGNCWKIGSVDWELQFSLLALEINRVLIWISGHSALFQKICQIFRRLSEMQIELSVMRKKNESKNFWRAPGWNWIRLLLQHSQLIQ